MALPYGDRLDFAARNLPLFVRVDDGRLSTGFRVRDRHLNFGGICHGGLIATFCDVHLAFAILFETELQATMLPTINLSVDYLAAGRNGTWVQANGEILRQTRNFVFAQTIVRADGGAIARASAVYKIGAPGGDGIDTGAWLRDFIARAPAASPPRSAR